MREVHVVHSVHEILGGDALAAEEATVQALDGVLSALGAVELDVDLSVGGARGDSDVHNLAVTVSALFLDVFFKLLIPTGRLSAR